MCLSLLTRRCSCDRCGGGGGGGGGGIGLSFAVEERSLSQWMKFSTTQLLDKVRQCSVSFDSFEG